MYFQASLIWKEGPAARNVTLKKNLFLNCNQGIGQLKGVIQLLPYPIQTQSVIFNLTIDSSTFNGQNLFFVNNCVVSNQSKPEEYYRLNKSYPCFDIFTGDIHLPPSPFNSSFPPPVFVFI